MFPLTTNRLNLGATHRAGNSLLECYVVVCTSHAYQNVLFSFW